MKPKINPLDELRPVLDARLTDMQTALNKLLLDRNVNTDQIKVCVTAYRAMHALTKIKPLSVTLYEMRRAAVNKYIDEEMTKIATRVAKPKGE